MGRRRRRHKVYLDECYDKSSRVSKGFLQNRFFLSWVPPEAVLETRIEYNYWRDDPRKYQ